MCSSDLTVEPQPKPVAPPATSDSGSSEPNPRITPVDPGTAPEPLPEDPGTAPEPVPDDTGAIEPSEVVGLTEDEARSVLAASGFELRVVVRDGEALAVTDDYRPRRANVAVVDGRVTAIENLG